MAYGSRAGNPRHGSNPNRGYLFLHHGRPTIPLLPDVLADGCLVVLVVFCRGSRADPLYPEPGHHQHIPGHYAHVLGKFQEMGRDCLLFVIQYRAGSLRLERQTAGDLFPAWSDLFIYHPALSEQFESAAAGSAPGRHAGMGEQSRQLSSGFAAARHLVWR